MSLCTGKIEGASKEGQMLVPLPDYTTGLQISVSCSEQGVGVFLSARVGGKVCDLLLDTGAQVSVVSKEFWQKATNGGSELVPYLGKVSVADGGQMNIVGKWSTVCQIEALALATDFLVADIPLQEIILGTDFLRKFGAVIDLNTRCCTLMGKSLPLQLGNVNNKTRTVSVRQDVIVPPRTEVIIPGSVEGVGPECMEGMLEPSDRLVTEVLVARVLCRVEKGMLPLRVINVTSEELILRKGMTIGTLCTDVQIGDSAVNYLGSLKDSVEQPWTAEVLLQNLGLNNRGLEPTQLQAVQELLSNYLTVFSKSDTDLGRTHRTLHQIDTGDAKPIKLAPRRVPLHLQQEVADHVKQMQEGGIIRPSCSPWAAPVVPVRKKDGSLRFCVDYRKLNDVTRKDAYPLPRIDDALDSLTHAQWFSTLDLASGYWQVEVDPIDRPKTAFITRQGLFEFNVLPFGLSNSPSTFQRLMDLILADLQWSVCCVYLDDLGNF